MCCGVGDHLSVRPPLGCPRPAHLGQAGAAGTYPVRQLGPRRLWTEAETAYRWWQNRGQPDRIRFGLTMSGTGQEVWLDEPGTIVRTWPALTSSAA
jgi:hypothetical protein